MDNETPAQVANRYDAKARMVATIAAYMGGTLSEGQACKILNIEPIDLRSCIEEYNVVAVWLWQRYRLLGVTVDNDIAAYQPPHCSRCSD